MERSTATGDSVRRMLENAVGHQYQLLRVLGRGGMGVVYLAREFGLERPVAIKVLAPEIASTPDSRERFRREARMAASLTHPGILPLYAFGEVGELAYIVMGYVRGETLGERLRHQRRIPPERARRILAQLAAALDYAHRHGVVHRDIKPDNILLDDQSDRVLLMDFGIAKQHAIDTALTTQGIVVGTPQYMSPEQAAGVRDIDGRSDLYSLGLVGYVMLAGRLPFEHVDPQSILRDLECAPDLRRLAHELPEELASAVMRCLARDPDARWPDAKALLDALAPVEGEEERLPAPLREITSFGTWTFLWLAVWGIAALRAAPYRDDWLLLAVVAVLVPFGFALHAWSIHRRGFGWRRILAVALWAPRWWGLWWPRALRRPDDVWDQLPESAKLARVLVTSFFIAAPVMQYAQWHASTSAGVWLRFAKYAVAAIVGAAVAACAWRLRRRGVSNDELARLLVGPTASGQFWTAPRIAEYLRAGAAGVGRSAERSSPTTASECLREISAAAERLGGPANPLACQIIVAAHQLVASLDALDAEICVLEREGDPGEITRIEHRLAGLASGGDDSDQEEMIALLHRQLEVLGRLQARLESVRSRRVELLRKLQTLWTAVAELEQPVGVVAGARDGRGQAVLTMCVEILDATAGDRAPVDRPAALLEANQ